MDDADLVGREQAVNQLVLDGQLVEAVERWCTDDVAFQEADRPPVQGLANVLEKEREFVDALAEIRSVECLGWAVRGDRSYSEWRFDFLMKDGSEVLLEQVAMRQWRDGKICFERFYHWKGL